VDFGFSYQIRSDQQSMPIAFKRSSDMPDLNLLDATRYPFTIPLAFCPPPTSNLDFGESKSLFVAPAGKCCFFSG
jgi:hypothetical protein